MPVQCQQTHQCDSKLSPHFSNYNPEILPQITNSRIKIFCGGSVKTSHTHTVILLTDIDSRISTFGKLYGLIYINTTISIPFWCDWTCTVDFSTTTTAFLIRCLVTLTVSSSQLSGSCGEKGTKSLPFYKFPEDISSWVSKDSCI